MELYFFQSLVRADTAPWLPDLDLARWALRVAWAVVLAAFVMRLCQIKWPQFCIKVAIVSAIWALLPGPLSPSYWLALAFQMPSLMSVLLCAAWIVQMTARHKSKIKGALNLLPGRVVVGLGVVLGWVLLADMLAWWPESVYAWGFGTPALALVCAATCLLWLTSGPDREGQRVTLYMAAVVMVYVITRLPSGNLWDALLDPWLWLVLHLRGLVFLIGIMKR